MPQGLQLVLHSDEISPVFGVFPGGINQQRQQLLAFVLRLVDRFEVVAQLIRTAQFKFRACHCLAPFSDELGKQPSPPSTDVTFWSWPMASALICWRPWLEKLASSGVTASGSMQKPRLAMPIELRRQRAVMAKQRCVVKPAVAIFCATTTWASVALARGGEFCLPTPVEGGSHHSSTAAKISMTRLPSASLCRVGKLFSGMSRGPHC